MTRKDEGRKDEGLEMNNTYNTTIEGTLTTDGIDPSKIPAGFKAGIRTKGIYASETIATGSDGTEIKASIGNDGNAMFQNADVTGTSSAGSSTVTGNQTVGSSKVKGNLDVSGNSTIVGDIILGATSKLKGVGGSSLLPPVGSMMSFLGTDDPDGWVICDGKPRPNDGRYNALNELKIGSINGTNYIPPDLTNRFLKEGTIHDKNLDSTLTLTQDQMPAHTHTGTTANSANSNLTNHTHFHENEQKTGWMDRSKGHDHKTTNGGNLNGVRWSGVEPAGQWDHGTHSVALGGYHWTWARKIDPLMRNNEWLRDQTTGWAHIDHKHDIPAANIDHTHGFTTGNAGGGKAINIPPPLYYGVKYIIKY